MTDASQQGLEILAPQPGKTFKLGGVEHTVSAVRMAGMKRFSDAATKVLPVIAEILSAADTSEGDDDRLAAVVGDNADDLIEFASAGTGLDKAQIGEMSSEEFIFCLVAVVTVNMSFFGQRLLRMTGAAGQDNKAQTGQKQSKR